MESIDRNSHLSYTRTAGILYLIIIIFGISSEIFVRSGLIVPGNAAATVSNILASKALYRAGFLADSVMLFCDVAIAVLFYIIFRPVNKLLSLTACVFRLVKAAILGVNLLNYYAPLLLADSGIYETLLSTNQVNALVMMFTDLFSHGYDLGLLFFAFSNLFLGYLIIKSKFLPAVLGYGLQAGAVVYLAGSYTHFLLPDFVPVFKTLYIIPLIAELSFCLWLLLKGINISE